jgi:hypothetical protein
MMVMKPPTQRHALGRGAVKTSYGGPRPGIDSTLLRT